MRSVAFVAALALALVAPLHAQDARPVVAPVRTEFDPRLDGMPFENMGDYASPEGNCFGMSLLAIDNYRRRLRARANGQPDPAPTPITTTPHGNVEAQILASLVHAVATVQDDGENNPFQQAPPSNTGLMREALERMRRTGVPEVLGMYAPDGSAHAVVVFGYEDGALLVYDPNYPGETIRWPWDPVRGFGPHPKRREGGPLYGPLKQYDVGPIDALRTSRELEALRDACAQGLDRCLRRFHELQGRLSGRPGARVITGRVGEGLRRHEDGSATQRPRRVWAVVDGVPVASGRVQRDGSFRITLPRTAEGGRRVQLVAVTDKGHLAGANDVDVPDPPAPTPPARPAPTASRTRGLAGAVDDARGR
ncbi:MAG: hypothetical protein KF878_16645 [Planctomycetes bacterium]|nr:hypothetical protein [Planctomycetota bacterium]